MPASLEHAFISKVVQSGDMLTPVEERITPEFFADPDSREMWEWVLGYWREHQTAPTPSVWNRQFAHVRLVDQEKVPIAQLVGEMQAAHRKRVLTDGLVGIVNAAKGDSLGAMAQMRALMEALDNQVTALRDTDLTLNVDRRIERWTELKNTPTGMRGLPTGFQGIDNITSGAQPQQLITLVGEPKTGKSTVALLIAMAAHEWGVPILFVSFEMSAQEQEARHDAFLAGVSHTRLTTGRLSKPEMDHLAKVLRRKAKREPFVISEDPHSLSTVSALGAKVMQYRPALLVVDGVYLMDDEHGEPKGSPQALTNITRSLKRMAQRFQIPILQTTQVLSWKLGNRKTRAVTADSIGYSSSFVQDSDLVLGVERDPEIDDVSILRVVLGRNVPSNRTVRIAWDWKTSDFAELGEGDEFDF
jgi:replicative DNA helicase